LLRAFRAFAATRSRPATRAGLSALSAGVQNAATADCAGWSRSPSLTYAEGADRETSLQGERAAALLRDLPERSARPRASVSSRAPTCTSCSASRAVARRRHRPPGERLLELAAGCERAAEGAGDDRLRANARYVSARVLTAHRGLHDAIVAYRSALELARGAGDSVAEVAILHNLGHALDSIDLGEGWAVLQEAHALPGRRARRRA
jgi:hypothetical protein